MLFDEDGFFSAEAEEFLRYVRDAQPSKAWFDLPPCNDSVPIRFAGKFNGGTPGQAQRVLPVAWMTPWVDRGGLRERR
jgi:hypothetical protein